MATSSMAYKRELIRTMLAALFGAAVVFLCVTPAQAQAPAPKKKRTVYVPPPTGSLLGGGYVDSGDTDTTPRPAATTVTVLNKPAFRGALANFDSQSSTVVKGYALIIPAVSWQTKVPVDTIKKQRAATGMTFGELLVANSLASGSGRSFSEILALHARTKNWEQVAKQLHVNIDSVTARLKTAAESIEYAGSRKNKEREQNLHETMSHTLPQQTAKALGGGG